VQSYTNYQEWAAALHKRYPQATVHIKQGIAEATVLTPTNAPVLAGAWHRDGQHGFIFSRVPYSDVTLQLTAQQLAYIILALRRTAAFWQGHVENGMTGAEFMATAFSELANNLLIHQRPVPQQPSDGPEVPTFLRRQVD
jgi:hypothetical protein